MAGSETSEVPESSTSEPIRYTKDEFASETRGKPYLLVNKKTGEIFNFRAKSLSTLKEVVSNKSSAFYDKKIDEHIKNLLSLDNYTQIKGNKYELVHKNIYERKNTVLPLKSSMKDFVDSFKPTETTT